MDVYDRGDAFDPTTDSIVRVEAGRLRSKLTQYYAAHGDADRIKISLPKGGYAVAIEINELPSADKAQQPTEILRRVLFAAIALSAVAVTAFVFADVILRSGPSDTDTTLTVSDRAQKRGTPAIAVLPFDNMSANPRQDYFSDGITEDIITDLSVLPGLTVIARNSTFAYKNQPTSIRTIARDLDVTHVLEGSVRRDGERVRITAQLIDAKTEAHIWADRYDRAIDDVFDIQEEVSRKIVSALELALPMGELNSEVRHTPNVIAHDAFLRAKEQFYRFDREGVSNAIDLFALAIERDASFAEAYSWQSRALVFAYISGFLIAKEDTVEPALDLAARAIALDASLPSANANLAWAKRWNGDFSEAEILINRATDLDPNFADGFIWKSLILSTVGKGDEALDAIERSNRLNPNYGATSIFALGRAKLEKNELTAAIEAFDRGIARNANFLPNYTFKMLALERSGDLEGVSAVKALMAEINPDYEQSASYRFYVDMRNKRE